MITRLRDCAPWASAKSLRNAGAANPNVNAETPPRMNSRRETAMCVLRSRLDELILGGADNQPRQTVAFRLQLRIRSRPRTTGLQERFQVVHRSGVVTR